eukprot:322715_1
MSVVPIGIILYILLTVFHMHQHTTPKSRKYLSSYFASYILITAGFIDLFILFSINYWQFLVPFVTTFQCEINLFLAVPIYNIFKSLFYCVLVLRAYDAYRDSPYSYNTKLLFTWIIVLFLWVIIHTTVACTKLTKLGATASVVNGQCIYAFSPLIVLSQFMIDLIAWIVNTYLFVKPMILIKRTIGNTQTLELKKVINKQAALNGIAILDLCLSITAVAVFKVPEPCTTQVILVLTFCVVLMFRWNTDLFYKLYHAICCCGCIITVSSITQPNDMELQSASNVKQQSELPTTFTVATKPEINQDTSSDDTSTDDTSSDFNDHIPSSIPRMQQDITKLDRDTSRNIYDNV